MSSDPQTTIRVTHGPGDADSTLSFVFKPIGQRVEIKGDRLSVEIVRALVEDADCAE